MTGDSVSARPAAAEHLVSRRAVTRVLRRACADADAESFVHVGDRHDPTIRYLTGYDGAGRAAVRFDASGTDDLTVYAPDASAVACGAPQRVRDDVGARVGATLPDAATTVATPRTVPHDAACYLEEAGVSVVSTDAVREARVEKTPAERAALGRAARAGAAGLDAVRDRLRTATVADGAVAADGDPLTREDIRRVACVAMARAGATPAATVYVPDAATEPTGEDPDAALPPGRPIVVEVTPRVAGYHAPLARTFVVDGAGGWERRAHVAAQGAIHAARVALRDGDSVQRATAEVRAELGAYGLTPDDEAGVHGVGLRPREAPESDADAPVGSVLAIRPRVTDGDDAVRLCDLVCVTADGLDSLADCDDGLAP